MLQPTTPTTRPIKVTPATKREPPPSPAPAPAPRDMPGAVLIPSPGAGNTVLGGIARFGGPYAVPLSELALGAWFALAQASHIVDVVSPGRAQLWRAGGGGAVWHLLAAIVGAGAAVHGLVGLVNAWRKR